MSGNDSTSGHRFGRHYTVAEACALIPQLTVWLVELRELRRTLHRQDERLEELLRTAGDQGGPRVEDWVRNVDRFRLLAREFEGRDLVIEDLEQGLVGFPAIRAGREVLLSWREGDVKIEFWKEIDGAGSRFEV